MKYKFLIQEDKSIVSSRGGLKWKIGEWQHVDGDIVLYANGLHCSRTIYDAFCYTQGSILAIVETKGAHLDAEFQSAYSDMRIVKAYKWTKKDSVSLAIFCAEISLKSYEGFHPYDYHPRQAIGRARAVLDHDTVKNRDAAWSASRLCNDWTTRLAAESAASYDSVWAARSARSAMGSLSSWYDELKVAKQMELWFKKRVKELEEIL